MPSLSSLIPATFAKLLRGASLSKQTHVVTVVTASATMLADSLYGSVTRTITNAVTFTLPIGTVGMHCTIAMGSTNIITITATTPDFIYINGVAGAAAGSIAAAAVLGNSVRLMYLGEGMWYADRVTGTWTAS